MTEPDSDSELVGRAVKGDQSAWNALVQRHGPRLWRIARSYRLDSAAAADVVQTAWLNLLTSLDQLHDQSAVGAWLNTVVRHEALRTRRRGERMTPGLPQIREPSYETDQDTSLVDQERLAAMHIAFERLTGRCQALLRALFQTDELGYGAVAATLGLPIGSIGPTRGRCLEQLRRLLRTNRYFADELRTLQQHDANEQEEDSE